MGVISHTAMLGLGSTGRQASMPIVCNIYESIAFYCLIIVFKYSMNVVFPEIESGRLKIVDLVAALGYVLFVALVLVCELFYKNHLMGVEYSKNNFRVVCIHLW